MPISTSTTHRRACICYHALLPIIDAKRPRYEWGLSCYKRLRLVFIHRRKGRTAWRPELLPRVYRFEEAFSTFPRHCMTVRPDSWTRSHPFLHRISGADAVADFRLASVECGCLARLDEDPAACQVPTPPDPVVNPFETAILCSGVRYVHLAPSSPPRGRRGSYRCPYLNMLSASTTHPGPAAP